MSIGTVEFTESIPAGSPCVGTEPEAESLDWLLAVLRQTIDEVHASGAPPLQKAGVIGRLGNLYMKTRRAAGLERTVKELMRRVAELEECLSVAGASAAPVEESPAAELNGVSVAEAQGQCAGAAEPANGPGFHLPPAPYQPPIAALAAEQAGAVVIARENDRPSARGDP